MNTFIREHNLRAAALWGNEVGFMMGRITAGIWDE